MATITVFDQDTQNSKTISVDLVSAIIQENEIGTQEYYIQFSTSAKRVSGAAIPTYTLQRLTDLVRGGTQQHGGSGSPYANMAAAIQDYILEMVEGDGSPDSEMNFS